jgi:hypothetical protein
MPDYKQVPDPKNFSPWQQDFKGTLGDATNSWRHQPVRTGPTQEDLILAINKLMGTAAARAVRAHAGIPFLMGAEPGITAVSPSEAAYRQAYDLIQGAKLPAEMDQASQTEMLMRHLRSQGIQP